MMRLHILVVLALIPVTTFAADRSLQDAGFGRAQRADTALAIRSAGYRCAEANRVERLIENGQTLPIFRVSCGDDGQYQASVVAGEIRIKPWTGRVFGN